MWKLKGSDVIDVKSITISETGKGGDRERLVNIPQSQFVSSNKF